MKKLSELNKEELYKVLMENRKMNTDEQFEIFEDALAEFAKDFKAEDVKLICDVFDEESECWDVMDGIIPLLESLDFDEYLKELALNSPNMIKGHNWAMQLNWRIFGISELVERYIRVIANLECKKQEKIIALLKDIKEYDPQDLAKIVDYIIDEINNYNENDIKNKKKYDFSIIENAKGVDIFIKNYENHILFNRNGFSYFDDVLKYNWYKKTHISVNWDYRYYLNIILSSCQEWDVIGIKFIDVDVVSNFSLDKKGENTKFCICKLKDDKDKDIYELREVTNDKVLVRAKGLELEVYRSNGRTIKEYKDDNDYL